VVINPDQWRVLALIINAGGCLVAAIFVSNLARDLWPVLSEMLGR
jgi:hypothetical protein